jgi:NAD(P)-dependent dehydrogenase (short-subunit alcohol dehydrogenase family)
VVTGGASGIGYAPANAYGQRGASVLIADRDDPALKTAHASLTDAGLRVRVRRQLAGDHMTNMTEPSWSRDTLGHRVCSFEIAFQRSERETVDDCYADD